MSTKARNGTVIPRLDSTDEIFAASIRALGESALGLGRAIEGLGKSNQIVEAKELSEQLKFVTRQLGWLVKQQEAARSQDGVSSDAP